MKKLLASLILCAGLAAGCADTDSTTTTTTDAGSPDDTAVTTTTTEQTTTSQPGRPGEISIESSPGTAGYPGQTTTTTDVGVTSTGASPTTGTTTDTTTGATASEDTDVMDREETARDQAYLDQLLTHSQEGLALAEEAARQSDQSNIRSLAEKMVSEHQSEISRINSLRERLFGSSPTVPTAQATGGDTTRTSNGVTAGANFEEAFLKEMLAHHREMLELSRDAQQNASTPDVKSLATEMVKDDQAEVQELEKLVANL